MKGNRKNIILIGYMGAGKTSVGKAYAGRFGKTLVDTDQLIEKEAGMPISQIFEEMGEEGFRRLESYVLEQLAKEPEEKIISTGGGLPMREENRRQLKHLGYVVYLEVKPDTVLKRLAGDSTRPLLQGDHVEETVQSMISLRSPVYRECACLTISVDEKTPEQIAEEIHRAEKGGGDHETAGTEWT